MASSSPICESRTWIAAVPACRGSMSERQCSATRVLFSEATTTCCP